MMTETKIIRLPDVLAKIGMSKPSVYNMIKRGEFPQQIKLGVKASGWLVSEIDAWIAQRVNARVSK